MAILDQQELQAVKDALNELWKNGQLTSIHQDTIEYVIEFPGTAERLRDLANNGSPFSASGFDKVQESMAAKAILKDIERVVTDWRAPSGDAQVDAAIARVLEVVGL